MAHEHEIGLKYFFWIGTVVMALSALGVILLITIYRNKVHKLKRKESDSLLNISLNSEKRERKRIASDLHDSISGDLSAVQNYVTILHNKEKDSFNKGILLEIETAIDNILQNVQDISYNLMPPMLDSLGIVSTLRSYFERVKKWSGITITEQYLTENTSIPSSDAYEVYRIIQELTTNMIKHGKPDHIIISVYNVGEAVVFEIQDNGISFNFSRSVKDPLGMGLKNITSRVRHINANLIQRPVEKGNKIQIHVNVKEYVANSDHR
ncbi:hypothetical protein CMT34_17465 [Elizabethkingia anophelis]|jgi:signal transduction histidine kinase|nr:hypothetical protein [Elizabethkingia anophelis]MDV4069981.1 hypothetical protein [Elizabethkingia anophelis]